MNILESSSLTRYLREHEHYYPGIEKWWEKRVIPDQISGKKVLFQFDRNFDIQGLGVVDLEQGKLCHLSLILAVRGTGLGRAILNLSMRELRENGYLFLWCHGPEFMTNSFMKWSGAKPIRDLGTFGRASIKDVMMKIEL